MRNHSHSTIWQLENLETRQLLSASIGLEPMIDGGSAVIAPLVRTPSIVGSFVGTNTINGRHQRARSATIDITSQTRRGVLAGTVTTGGETNSITGRVSGNSFTLTLIDTSNHDEVTTIIGTVSARGLTLSGTFSDSEESGVFTVSR